MPVAGGGFEQCYNAQAVVAAGSLLVVAAQVVQAPNDKQQIEPMLKRIEALPADLGKPETLLADNGYFSDANVALCAAAQIAGAGEPDAARGHEPSSADARRQEALCLAQADSGTGVRHHQIGDGLPPVPPAWP